MNKIFLLIAFLFSSSFSISSFTYPWIINLTGDTATVVKWKSNNDTVKAFCDRAADTITNNSSRLDAVDDSIDNRYTKSASDDRYLNKSGDTATGSILIQKGDAGAVTASTDADELVLENNGNAGLSILTPDDSYSRIYMGSPSDGVGAYWQWRYGLLQARLTTATTGGILQLGAGDQVNALVLTEDSVTSVKRITSPIIGDTVVDYAATSTVTGWSSFTTKLIKYQKCGKVVTVWGEIIGTSNSATTTFTLPTAIRTAANMSFLFIGVDNGGSKTSCSGSVVTANDIVTLNYTVAGAGWTTSGTKAVFVQFTYFID